jgi:hypothetical protein
LYSPFLGRFLAKQSRFVRRVFAAQRTADIAATTETPSLRDLVLTQDNKLVKFLAPSVEIGSI